MNTATGENIDPMPIGLLGMWLFLASEAMFFVGLLGAFIVLDSAAGQHTVFIQSSRLLNNSIGISSAVLLVGCFAILHISKWASLAGVFLVLLLQALQWKMLLHQNYGPSHNNFFACYFLLTAAHGIHLIIGIAVILCLRGKMPAAVQIYWQFVNVIGIICLAALYLV